MNRVILVAILIFASATTALAKPNREKKTETCTKYTSMVCGLGTAQGCIDEKRAEGWTYTKMERLSIFPDLQRKFYFSKDFACTPSQKEMLEDESAR